MYTLQLITRDTFSIHGWIYGLDRLNELRSVAGSTHLCKSLSIGSQGAAQGPENEPETSLTAAYEHVGGAPRR